MTNQINSQRDTNNIAIVLVNLGTPQAPTVQAVRSYLREFLSDTRVVEIPKWIWWWVLHGLVLPFRSKTSAAKYQAIWTEDGSPLAVHTKKQAMLLRGYLGESGTFGRGVEVLAAMRYGEPALSTVLQQLQQRGFERILLLPAYPQYSGTTTASIFDAAFMHYRTVRNIPELRCIKQYYDNPGYIHALKQGVLRQWQRNGRGEHLVMSFHGIPERTVRLGDPYYVQCQQTACLLAESLGLSKADYTLTFQSRFGKAKWLQPYTLPTIVSLANQGLKRLDVICPGFISDCLETLEEVNIELRHSFMQAGGKQFNYIPCLNEDEDWIHGLVGIVQPHLTGWSNIN